MMLAPVRQISALQPQSASPRVAVLLNANAKKVTPRVREAYESLVPRGDLYWSRSFEEAAEHMSRIVERGYQTLFTGGGDGTILNTVEMLFDQLDQVAPGARCPKVGVLKLGTGNAMAHWVGAHAPTQHLRDALEGRSVRSRRLTLIEEGNRLLPFAGIGWDAAILNDYISVKKLARNALTRKLANSLFGYAIAISTKTIPQDLMRKNPVNIRVRNLGRAEHIMPNGVRLPIPRGSLLFEGPCKMAGVATMPYYGYGMQVFPYAGTEIGKMHLRIVTMGVFETLWNLPSIWRGEYRSPRILDFLLDGVEIESEEPVPYQIGGDAEGKRHKLTFNMSSKSIEMLDFHR